MKYWFILCFSSMVSFSYSQTTIPSRKELAKKWLVGSYPSDSSSVYLINPKLVPNTGKGNIEFFINQYTSTLRIKYVEPLGGFPECVYKRYRTCGNEARSDRKRRDSLIKIHCRDYTKESLCAYDASKGLLKIKDSAFLGGTLFQIEYSNFKEIILKRIK